MEDFVLKFGVDWKLLLSQVVNFLILLVILRLVAYKPIIEILKKRKAHIDEGLANADAADKRLSEIEILKRGQMAKAEAEAQALMKATEDRAKDREAELMTAANKKVETALAEAKKLILAKRAESEAEIGKEAVAMVKEALLKTVALDPSAVHEALVKEALAKVSEGETF
ncbi:MAG: hypothetical protein WC764_02865 [Candidatus Paceibacterota bacterium]|jgi:F-type H+-transporting ATPase subunit b